MGVGGAGMDKNMEVLEGTKSGSSVWFSSPTPRHGHTHGISEQDRCPVWDTAEEADAVLGHPGGKDGIRGREAHVVGSYA